MMQQSSAIYTNCSPHSTSMPIDAGYGSMRSSSTKSCTDSCCYYCHDECCCSSITYDYSSSLQNKQQRASKRSFVEIEASIDSFYRTNNHQQQQHKFYDIDSICFEDDNVCGVLFVFRTDILNCLPPFMDII